MKQTKGHLIKIYTKKTVIVPTKLGNKVLECWYNIERLNPNIRITDFVMMPNHIHGIIAVNNENKITPSAKKFDFNIAEDRTHRSIQGLIKDFKSVTTRYYKKEFGASHSLWQDSFYDTVIRNTEQYTQIRKYIYENPYKWSFDSLFRPE